MVEQLKASWLQTLQFGMDCCRATFDRDSIWDHGASKRQQELPDFLEFHTNNKSSLILINSGKRLNRDFKWKVNKVSRVFLFRVLRGRAYDSDLSALG